LCSLFNDPELDNKASQSGSAEPEQKGEEVGDREIDATGRGTGDRGDYMDVSVAGISGVADVSTFMEQLSKAVSNKSSIIGS
jgi:hypothetical protein